MPWSISPDGVTAEASGSVKSRNVTRSSGRAAGMRTRQTDLSFNYQREFRGAMPEAYERLLKSDVRYRFVIDMASLKNKV